MGLGGLIIGDGLAWVAILIPILLPLLEFILFVILEARVLKLLLDGGIELAVLFLAY